MFDLIVTLIPAIPLFAALVTGVSLLLGDRLHYRVVQRLICGAIFLSMLGSIWVAVEVFANPTPREIVVYRWLYSGDLNVQFAFLIDSLTAIMLLVVTTFSFVIAKFSINYMHRDYSFTRYFTAFGLFVFAMLVLVMGNNYVMLFLGWESVGVCSYLMIGHYYDRVNAARAGTQAFVMNRVGDAGFLMGIFLIATNFQTVNYTEVFAKLNTIDSGTATAIGLSLLLGAIGKSAQLPLGTWLAKAMEGPTPSSALIHAATMVTAGVYMIVRSHDLYNMAPNALFVIAIVGAATAVYGATVGATLPDIKGILAASTTTQLGLMFLACGLGAYVVAIFHLVAHAFLKSYLFLTAPSILHHMHTKPDVTKTEKSREPVPITYWLILVGTVAMVVAPFVGGWWTDALTVGPAMVSYYVLLAGGAMALFAVVFYAEKMTRYAFFEDDHGGHGAAHGGHGDAHDHHSPFTLVAPLIVIAAALGIGLFLGLLPGGMPNTWFQALLAPIMGVDTFATGGHPLLAYSLLAMLAAMLLFGWFSAIFLERFKPELPGLVMLRLKGVYNVAMNRFWLDEFYDIFVIQPSKRLGQLLDRLDTNVIDRAVGAPAPAGKIATAVSTWEERYLAVQAAGAQQAAAHATTEVSTWEDEEHRAKSAGEPQGVVGWLIKLSTRTSGWAEKEIGHAPGVIGGMTESAATIAGWTERELVGKATGVLGNVAEAAASLSSWTEKEVFGRTTGVVGWFTDVSAAVANWVERIVFEGGIQKGVPLTGGLFGRVLFRVEEILGHPLVIGSVILAGVALLMVGALS